MKTKVLDDYSSSNLLSEQTVMEFRNRGQKNRDSGAFSGSYEKDISIREDADNNSYGI